MKSEIHYIHGQWCTGSDQGFSSENPCSGELLWSGDSAGQAEVDRAVGAARHAFELWSTQTLEQRIAFLRRYQEVLKSKQDIIADIISQEAGKPKWEAKTEVGAMIGKVDLSIDAYHKRTGEAHNENNGVTSRVCHRPLGVMAVFGPYNFPGHLPNGHIVPALLAGNTIVYKPSELTPLVASTMLRCLIDAGLPQGVVNMVQGEKSTGMLLSAHGGIDGLLFTGSSQTGAAIHRQFAGQPHKLLALEMGGNNPLIVHKAQDVTASIYNIVQSAFITAGQRCTCARRLIIVNSDENSRALLDGLKVAVSRLLVGCPDAKVQPFMGPVISNAAADQLLDTQERLYKQGAEVIVAMQRVAKYRPLLSPGLLDVTNIKKREDEEFFGPLLQVIRVDTLDQAIAEANNTKFGLAAGIITDDDEVWARFYQASRAGIVNRNRPLTGASGGAPFGGTGASGNHRPSAFYAADYSAYPVASLEDDVQALPETLAPGVAL